MKVLKNLTVTKYLSNKAYILIKLSTSLVFIIKCYFAVSKNIHWILRLYESLQTTYCKPIFSFS